MLHYYLAGFVDGEGSFSVSIIKHPTQKFGWMINPCFQVYQRSVQILVFSSRERASQYRCSETSYNVWSAARLQGEILDEVQSAQMYPASSWRLFSGP